MAEPIDLESLASSLHQGWLEYQSARGVRFGPTRTPTTHPHFLPWQELDCESQGQDRFIAAVLLRDWNRGLLSFAALPAAIHDAWAEWSQIQGENHPHARPYLEAHADGDDEHTRQARLISEILNKNSAS